MKTVKISRIELLLLVTDAIQEGDHEKANKLLAILDRSIQSDKSKSTYSKEIDLTKEQEKLLKSVEKR